jgi:26S proteasome regulatory subunit T5
MIENEAKMLRHEASRLNHEIASMKTILTDNLEKVKLNQVLPYLVSNVVEVRDEN